MNIQSVYLITLCRENVFGENYPGPTDYIVAIYNKAFLSRNQAEAALNNGIGNEMLSSYGIEYDSKEKIYEDGYCFRFVEELINTEPIPIKSIHQLRELSGKRLVEGYISLEGNGRSSKTITYNKRSKKYHVFNLIDSTIQKLNAGQLRKESNIVWAMKNNAFYLD